MERSGTRPAPDVPVDDLRELVGAEAPFTSVYLPLERAIDNAAPRNELRWKTLRDQLDGDAPIGVLEAIDDLVPGAHHDAQCIAILCAGADPVIVEPVDEITDPEGTATCDSLPRLAPVIASRQRAAAYVVAMVDRRGADLVGVTRGGREIAAEVAHDEADRPESKKAPGGWSQPRYQRRVENRWEEGAQAVAEAVHELAEKVGARLVVLGGDERTLTLLEEALPSSTAEIVRIAHENRAAGSESDLDDQVRRYVHDVTARDTVAVIEKLREELGQHDRAVQGAAMTLGALQRSQVDVLLVHDDAEDTRRAWFGEEPGQVALERADLDALNVESPSEGRLVDVAIHAALVSGAEVRVVPKGAGPDEGIGALLRWS